MPDLDTTVSQFIDQWNAGQRPSVENAVAEVAADDRAELRRQLGAFLAVAPTPRYDAETVDALLVTPIVDAAVEAFEGERGAWPVLLPRLRAQAGLSLRELAERVLAAASLTGRNVAKAEDRLREMERGDLDATGVSERLVEVLGRVLSVRAFDLAQVGMPAAATGSKALFRREDARGALGADLDLLADALATPVPGQEWDEVDELFFGAP
ncbi:MAG: hypothetical protein QOG15_1967 [Solirubrobacteraceae bacterium]|jgi:CTP:molybdopterin cytidylyltransferase MocA|nr:hypothetical protein [Solirubrobacteraceae bacterium]